MALLPALLTTDEVAEEFRVHPKTVRQWANDGKISAITLPGGTKRYPREAVEAILRGEQTGDAA